LRAWPGRRAGGEISLLHHAQIITAVAPPGTRA
jgi:hypothetical protein